MIEGACCMERNGMKQGQTCMGGQTNSDGKRPGREV